MLRPPATLATRLAQPPRLQFRVQPSNHSRLAEHDASDGGFLFASFISTFLVFGVYAVNLFLVSLGNVQSSGFFALLFSTVCSVCAVFYQVLTDLPQLCKLAWRVHFPYALASELA